MLPDSEGKIRPDVELWKYLAEYDRQKREEEKQRQLEEGTGEERTESGLSVAAVEAALGTAQPVVDDEYVVRKTFPEIQLHSVSNYDVCFCVT